MENKNEAVADYFSAPQQYYWQWGENGEILEFNFDLTVCYTDELLAILEAMSDQGWPPLGSILLVLAACKEDGKHIHQITNIIRLYVHELLGQHPELYETLFRQLYQVKALLEIIARLPPEYRSGKKRTLLLKTIFTTVPAKINSSKAKQLLHHFYKSIFHHPRAQHLEHLVAELESLAAAAAKIKDREALELMLQTSLEIVPAPLPVALTDLPETDLFTQLAADNQTAGISRLAKRILATLQIPVHTQHNSDQSLGGISDISNKGNYDRLLISELAQDDHVLMARIANNEALYLKREALSVQPEKDSVLLIDASLKMWGIPRAFAIAAALACIQYDKKSTNVIAYTLKGTTVQPADLSSKKGVIDALSVLDNHLHSAVALTEILEQEKPHQSTCFLITSEELLLQPEFRQTVTRLQTKLSYLVTVNRNGQFCLYHYSKGQKKLHNAALLNPEELLFAPAKAGTTTPHPTIANLPEVFNMQPFPLFHPASRLKRLPQNNALFSNQEVLCVTTDLRVLYWQKRIKGAIELCPLITNGTYYFGTAGPQQISILVNAPAKEHLQLYVFDSANTSRYTLHDINIPTGQCQAIYLDHYFQINHATGQYAICGETGKPGTPIGLAAFNQHYITQSVTANQHLNHAFRFINKGYNTISKVENIYINDTGHLMLGNRQIKVIERKLKLYLNPMETGNKKLHSITKEEIQHPVNHHITFTKFNCTNGVTMYSDSRGFLHMQTDDHSLPEVTLTMVTDIEPACRASDNTCCGNDYFIQHPDANMITPYNFYTQYIQPYIDRMKWN